jgi:hypothetical protein
MNLGKGAKVLLGLATAWPLVWMLIFLSAGLYQVFSETSLWPPTLPSGTPRWMLYVIAVHSLTCVLNLAILATYMIHLFKSDRVSQDKKVFWAVVLLAGNVIAMPVFFYLYVWKDAPSPPPPGGPA